MYDPVSFYYQIEVVLASNTSKESPTMRQSQWLFLDAADTAINASILINVKIQKIFTQLISEC